MFVMGLSVPINHEYRDCAVINQAGLLYMEFALYSITTVLLLSAVVRYVNLATSSVGVDECSGRLRNIEEHPEVLVSTSSVCFSAPHSCSTLSIAFTCQ